MDRSFRNRVDKSFDLVRRIPLQKLDILDRSQKSISDLKIGSLVIYENETYLVTDKYSYYKKKKDVLEGQEFQLTNILNGEVKYLEYSIDDVIAVYITLDEIPSGHVDYDVIKRDRMVTIDGEEFFFDDKWTNRFVKEGESLDDSVQVKMMEFESESERYCTFEFWEDGSVSCFISEEIPPFHIEIVAI